MFNLCSLNILFIFKIFWLSKKFYFASILSFSLPRTLMAVREEVIKFSLGLIKKIYLYKTPCWFNDDWLNYSSTLFKSKNKNYNDVTYATRDTVLKYSMKQFHHGLILGAAYQVIRQISLPTDWWSTISINI